MTLQPGALEPPDLRAGPGFVVTFANQGENDEFDIKVTVRISSGAQQTTLTTTVPTIAQGATARGPAAVNKQPPLAAWPRSTAQVAPVPGEKKTDNNRSEYNALFSRG